MMLKRFSHDAGNGGGGSSNDNGSTTERERSELERARDEAARYRTRLREAEARLKEKEDAETSAETERQRKAGEHEKIIARLEKQLEEATGKLKGFEGTEEKIAALEKRVRAELLEKLPEAQRKLYTGDDVTTGEIERAVKAFSVSPNAATSTRRSSAAAQAAGEANRSPAAGEINLDELAELAKSDPSAYNTALAELVKGSMPTGGFSFE